jgi:hypothetical protein
VVEDPIRRTDRPDIAGTRDGETADVPVVGTRSDHERRSLICTVELALSGTHACRLSDGTTEFRLEPGGTSPEVLVWAPNATRPYEAASAEVAVQYVLSLLWKSTDLYVLA